MLEISLAEMRKDLKETRADLARFTKRLALRMKERDLLDDQIEHLGILRADCEKLIYVIQKRIEEAEEG